MTDLEPAQVCSVEDETKHDEADVYQEIICDMVSRVDESVSWQVK